MSVFQKLDDPQHRRGYEWRFDDVMLVGIQKYAAQLAIVFASGARDALKIRHARPVSNSASGITSR